MRKFKQFYLEARKNPEQNPKISVYEYLKPYSKDPNIYISFTDVDKIGVNPNSTHSTPLGIYCYPLVEIWKEYKIDYRKSLKGLPFAADRPYIWVLENVAGKSFINDMYSDYGSSNIDKDLETLKQIWEKECDGIDERSIHYDVNWQQNVDFCIAKIANILEWKDINNKFLFRNSLKDIIPKLETINIPDNKFESLVVELKQLKLEIENYIKTTLFAKKLEQAKTVKSNPITAFWYISKCISLYLSKDRTSEAIVRWNKLLRQCGYSGFADKSGRGYIHSYEPMQAVFLTKSAFRVRDKILNKDYDKKSAIKTPTQYIQYLKSNGVFGVPDLLLTKDIFVNYGYVSILTKTILKMATIEELKTIIDMGIASINKLHLINLIKYNTFIKQEHKKELIEYVNSYNHITK